MSVRIVLLVNEMKPRNNLQIQDRPKNKNHVYPVSQLTLFFTPDPKAKVFVDEKRIHTKIPDLPTPILFLHET